MIDTIRVKYSMIPKAVELEAWTIKSTATAAGTRYVLVYNPKSDTQVFPRYTFYPLGYDSKPLLTLEVSLPKLIFNNNYQMLENIDTSIEEANVLLANVPHAPILDLGEGVLIRMDTCYNHQVGEAVDDYIKAIGNLDFPHRRTKHHRYEGVEFRAKHRTTKFYNKERESGFIEAHGLLRQETTIMDRMDIQRLFQNSKPTLRDVSVEKIADALRNDLTKLGLLNNSIANRDIALQTLCDVHGENAGVFYYGLLMSKTGKSRKQLVRETDTHPRSLDRKLRRIVQTGIPLTLTDREEALPPLTINL
jgi:hypothetical protein